MYKDHNKNKPTSNIIFDATVFEMPFTGIANSTIGLYRSIVESEPLNSFRFTGLHRKKLFATENLPFDSIRIWPYLPFNYWRNFAAPYFFNKSKSKVIHFPFNGGIPCTFPDKKIIMTLNDVLPLRISGYFSSSIDEEKYRKKVQADIDKSDEIITISSFSKKEIEKNFILNKEVTVIPIACTLGSETSTIFKGKPTSPYFIYNGGYDARKGMEPLVRVFLDLYRNKRTTSKLVLVGKPRYFSSSFKLLIKESVELGAVIQLGYVADGDLVWLIKNAKALLYLSKDEGFGMPPLEAMTLGCPVITTNQSSLPEVCGEAALYVDPDNDYDLASAILSFDNSENLRSSFINLGIEQSKKFSWDKSAAQFLDIYSKLVK